MSIMNESVNGTLKSEAAPVKTHLSLFFFITYQHNRTGWDSIMALCPTVVLDVCSRCTRSEACRLWLTESKEKTMEWKI